MSNRNISGFKSQKRFNGKIVNRNHKNLMLVQGFFSKKPQSLLFRFVSLFMFTLKQNKAAKKLLELCRQGTSPRQLAVSSTTALLLGIFPVFGVTTWITTFIAIRCKLNLPLMLALLYLVWPVQIGLAIPFLRLGEWFFQVPPLPLAVEEIQLAFEADFLGALGKFGEANLFAVGGWLAVSAFVGPLLYFLLVKIFQHFSQQQKLDAT